MGGSGCGKSVLALAVLGLLSAGAQTSEQIRHAGINLLTADEPTLQSIRGPSLALIPQSAATHLTPVRTIGSVVAETLRHHRRPAAPQDIAALLADVDLPEGTADRCPQELPGGIAQRVLSR